MKTWIIFLSFAVFFNLRCATGNKQHTDIPKPQLSENEYKNLVAQFTSNDKQYSGLYNKYQVTATILNSKIQEAKLDKLRFYLQQDSQEFQKERNRTFQKMSVQSQVFMSFFATEKDYKNLHRPTSLWKIYLEHNGQRYKGRITKDHKLKVDLKSIFPYHNRWSTGYFITFNVPMTSVEKSKAKFILTSSAGKTVFEFSELD